MNKPHVVIVGGLLGAGKTRLLRAAAQLLRNRGQRVSLITNDQTGGLVDTAHLLGSGFATAEIAGGCFCCRLTDFSLAVERELRDNPDVIVAEPVGSCTDLAATVLRPLMNSHSDRLRIAPLTVLVDPHGAERLINSDDDLGFLFRKQIAEADVVCFSKADLHPVPPALPGIQPRAISSVTGLGLAEWLDDVLSGKVPAAGKQLDIDYVRYAAAEAALGWLNWEAIIEVDPPQQPSLLVSNFVQTLEQSITGAGARIAHLKAWVESPNGGIKISVTETGGPAVMEGDSDAGAASRHRMILNLRAIADPDLLRQLVSRATRELPGQTHVSRFEAFRPAAPQPERRLALGGVFPSVLPG